MGIGLGIFLIAVGAILAFAVVQEPAGLDLDATGWILMIVGLAVVLLTLALWSYRRYTRVVEREAYPPVAVYPPVTQRIVERPVYPPVTERIVEREAYPPAVDRVVEREAPRNSTDRIIEREVYRDELPP